MKIPSGLNRLLNKETKFRGQVDLTINLVTPIFTDNKTPFFPEYTDHGLRHVENVLRAAYSIMSDQAQKVITSADAFVLVFSCVLHDIAMHISKDGFVSLVSTDDWRIVPEFGDKPWKNLWADFRNEGRHFNERTLKSIFGTTEPIDLPSFEPETWHERHLKFIGEFIRRHHHRLAHQIALNGIPGVKGKRISLEIGEPDIADLAGLVARSHGMPIRDSFNYLENKYDALREYKNIHCVFLMALLRVADFLQIESDRAPNELLTIKSLRSPISQREWNSHSAIRNITADLDKESFSINALPDNVETYLRLQDLLNSLQAELDSSWAILGEVYSRFSKERLDKLGLSFRRVKSNLIPLEEFAKKVEYVPCRAAFSTSGAELMNLLVEPLYGKDPFIAIRELIQNSVDAVRERDEYIKTTSSAQSTETTDQSVDVLITLQCDSEGVTWIKVDDKGIGMTAETLQLYFLTAGASLRNNVDWRKCFADENGNLRMLRSGRFGIGVFASLLLGSTIHVSTRHINSAVGLEFHASLSDEFIELKKCQRPVGTSIRIRIDEETAMKLLQAPKQWDWYLLDNPSVRRDIAIENERFLVKYIETTKGSPLDTAKKELSQLLEPSKWQVTRKYIPQCGSNLPADWNRIYHKNYSDVQWTYGDAPLLTCNGIIVKEHDFSLFDSRRDEIGISELNNNLNTHVGGYIRFKLPHCSCFDPNGALPVIMINLKVQNLYQMSC